MGRRKIEIKAIKDDRNRSVTFLKRKGGLFKKAHELSVLCSVDVAVIIFGQNKKLYQYSSGDIQQTITRHQYYGPPHEHKGPSDFQGKGANDDEDEDDDNPGSPEQSPPHLHANMAQQPHVLQAQPGMHHVTHRTPQNSPPLNGSFGSRMASPQPNHLSRPASRTHVRRVSSNLVPQNHPHPHAAQPTTQPPQYGYSQGGSFYTQGPPPPSIQVQGRQPPPPPPQQQGTPPLQHQQHQFPHQHSTPNAQMQHLYLQEQGRRQSMPPNFPMQDQEQRQLQVNTQPMAQHQFRSPQPQARTLDRHNHSHSIFTPVDDDRSILAQRFGLGGGTEAMPRESAVRPDMGPRSNSADGNALRININGQSPRNQFAPPPSNQNIQAPQRSGSVHDFGPPPRTPGFQAPQGKRPSLKVQIPSEQSESESATAGSSSKDGQPQNQITTPARAKAEGGTGIVLPPPSPRSASAGAVLSAGATGPANPFARPPLPHQTFGARDSDNVQTPASALPSRMMGDLMNSPSNFWSNSEWGLGSFGGNSLVSPATYQPTPVQTSNPAFREGSIEKRRNSSEEPTGGPPKRAKV